MSSLSLSHTHRHVTGQPPGAQETIPRRLYASMEGRQIHLDIAIDPDTDVRQLLTTLLNERDDRRKVEEQVKRLILRNKVRHDHTLSEKQRVIDTQQQWLTRLQKRCSELENRNNQLFGQLKKYEEKLAKLENQLKEALFTVKGSK